MCSSDLILGTEYRNWKQLFKNYCYDFDGLEEWKNTKTKFNSVQTIKYTNKKLILKNLRWLLILSNGTVVSTPNLPLLNEKEYRQCYGNTLDYLFQNGN